MLIYESFFTICEAKADQDEKSSIRKLKHGGNT